MKELGIIKEIREELFALQDKKYRDFHSNLMPTIDKDLIIGVRVPVIRKLAKKYGSHPEIALFLQDLPHKYYEENNLHAFIIAGVKDYEVCIDHIEQFLPCVNNWATCDSMSPVVFKKHLPQLFVEIQKWICSDHVYTKRFAIGMLMKHYLDQKFEAAYAEMVASVKSDDYYVNMMIAWYFATALAKQYEKVIPYIEQHRLDEWIHRKTIQKAIESRRIPEDRKAYLRLQRD